MAIRVLIVDDSGFFRHRIEEMLSGDKRIAVVGTAANGREAVEQARVLRPDVITMDVEMPQLNGIEAVRIIMRECPTSVLMLSSLTNEGARITLDALDAGAADYLSKDIRLWMEKSPLIRTQLIDRILALGSTRRFRSGSVFEHRYPHSNAKPGSSMVFRGDGPKPAEPSATERSAARRATLLANTALAKESAKTPLAESAGPGLTSAPSSGARRSVLAGAASGAAAPLARSQSAVRPATTAGTVDSTVTSNPSRVQFPDCRLVVIGSSTGGPAALQHVLTKLPADFPYPILLVQHMPKTFTQVFAQRLDQQCRIQIKEAEDGDRLRPGQALLAPGGLQMMIDPKQTDQIRILVGDDKLTYKPSVDVTYASAARTYGNKVLALILTGMGADGCDGARLLKREGATVWAQNRETCTIYGMPQAVVSAGLADEILALDDIGPLLAKGRRS